MASDLLEAMAAEAPARELPSAGDYSGGRLLVSAWLTDRGMPFNTKRAGDGRDVYLLERCPFDASHGGTSEVCIMQDAAGKLSALCMHSSCAGRGWQEFKAAIGQPEARHYDRLPAGDVDLSAFHLAEAAEAGPVDPGPLPEHLLRVPGFIGDVMAHTLATAPYPEPALAFTGALALQAFLASRKVRDPQDNRSCIYLLGLAGPGVGKDQPRKVAKQILCEAGLGACFGGSLASSEGIEDALFTQPASLFLTDEMDNLLLSMKHGKEPRYEKIASTLLELYTSANSIYSLRLIAKREPRIIDQPALTLFCTAIPKNCYESLSAKMLMNGFFARLLIVEAGKRSLGQEPVAIDVPDSIRETANWWAEFQPGEKRQNLSQWHPKPKVIQQSAEASAILADYRGRCDAEYQAAEARQDNITMAIWGRANEKARRLTVNYAASENHQAPEINAPAARWACELVDHLTRRMLFMAGAHVSESPFHADCLRLKQKLREASGTLPHSVLLKRMKMDARAFGTLIQTLVQQGDLEVKEASTAGRPVRHYSLARGQ